jgi:transaldolase
MERTKVEKLAEFGQSVWLDFISRSLIKSGRLKEMIGWGLRGMTSNPTIFDQAISASNDYDGQLKELNNTGRSVFEVYDDLTVRDIQDAADAFRSVYEISKGRDGYVSLEINPKLAYETKETIDEGKRVARKVSRPNVMFKVPATDDGYEAIAALLAEGINVNVTLIFSLEQYRKTAAAYLQGMRGLRENGGDPRSLRSVASVFVSRLDTAVDKLLDGLLERDPGEATKREEIESLKGKAAVANANLIYGEYVRIFSGEEFTLLQKEGAAVQRVLWGSTGTKNPAYSDIKYVTELMGKDTVNTLPQKTIEAFLDHGEVRESLTANVEKAQRIMGSLQTLDIDVTAICAKLLHDGVIAFERSFESLLESIEKKMASL